MLTPHVPSHWGRPTSIFSPGYTKCGQDAISSDLVFKERTSGTINLHFFLDYSQKLTLFYVDLPSERWVKVRQHLCPKRNQFSQELKKNPKESRVKRKTQSKKRQTPHQYQAATLALVSRIQGTPNWVFTSFFPVIGMHSRCLSLR